MNRFKIDLSKIDPNDKNALMNLFHSDLDCKNLKKFGIDFIKKIGGNVWNNYSPHDPGITMLDEICYTIADLDYRIRFQMEDLLADNPNEVNNIKYFHTPEEIFPCSPITTDDYRRLILDVPGVRNCRILPVEGKENIKGLYDVYLYLEFDDEKDRANILNTVSDLLNKNRNIGEDFNSIKTFNVVDVCVDLLLEVNDDVDRDRNFSFDDFAAKLLADIQNFFIPYNNFLLISEALEKEKNLENIFNGPILDHGYIANFAEGQLKNEYLVFNIINFLLKNKEIKKVKSIEVRDINSGEVFPRQIKLAPDQVVRIIFKQSKVTFVERNRVINTNENIVTPLAKRLNIAPANARKLNDEEFDFYRGNYRDLTAYYPVQNGLPTIYGTTEAGVKENNDDPDKVYQLKAYLLFFETFFLQYHWFLDAFKHNISIHSDHNCSKDFKFPDNIYDMKKILRRPSEFNRDIDFVNRAFCIQKRFIVGDKVEVAPEESKFLVGTCNKYMNKLLEHFWNKGKHRNLTYHLLSRYAEGKESLKNLHQITHSKLLENYPLISTNRAKGATFLRNDEIFDSRNISVFEYKFCTFFNVKNSNRRLLHSSFLDSFSLWNGLKKQQQAKVGANGGVVFNGKFSNIFYLVLKYGGNVDNYLISDTNDLKKCEIKLFIDSTKTKFLSMSFKNGKVDFDAEEKFDFEKNYHLVRETANNIRAYNENTEGIHCIEHIMLRTSDFAKDDDVHSNKISIIFPDWPMRFQDKVFRLDVENWIKEELPAHISANILWLNMEDMKNVEYTYKHWLSLKKSSIYDKSKIDAAAESLLQILLKLHSEQK